MSTERKPGSRGVTKTFSGDPANRQPPIGSEPGARDKTRTKGSTKTESPRKSFKKKRK